MQPRAQEIQRRQARLARRARLVRWAKWVLPLGALTLIAAIFLAGRQGGDAVEVFTPEELARLGAGLRLENPRLAGITARDQPYELTADAAVPEGPMAEEVTLEEPRGWIESGDRRISAVAERAHLDRRADRLDLTGGVALETTDGWRGETARLAVELDRRRATGSEPVRATGPRGSLEAGSFRVEQPEGEDTEPTIWFENGVHVLFIPPSAEAPG